MSFAFSHSGVLKKQCFRKTTIKITVVLHEKVSKIFFFNNPYNFKPLLFFNRIKQSQE
jgi:hypothetical protein